MLTRWTSQPNPLPVTRTRTSRVLSRKVHQRRRGEAGVGGVARRVPAKQGSLMSQTPRLRSHSEYNPTMPQRASAKVLGVAVEVQNADFLVQVERADPRPEVPGYRLRVLPR